MKPQDLSRKVEELKKEHISKVVAHKIRQFEELGKKGNEAWFSELCFCLLTANCSASTGIRIQKEIGRGFLTLHEEDLAEKLKKLGHRFPNTRAKFIYDARSYPDIKDIVTSFKDERKARSWIVRHIKGLGWKESSHFLRNVGYKNVAIIDRHILRTMEKYGLIPRVPKNLNRRFYLEYEEKLEKLAEKAGIALGELDLYLWYMATGKVLK